MAILLRGTTVYCPICRQSYRKFRAGGVVKRPDAMCPKCNSLERHRLLLSVLDKLYAEDALRPGGRMLHIAPEPGLAQVFRARFDYVSADLGGGQAMVAMDITRLGFPDGSFDAVVCNHVLEHVPDDRTALSELHRVMVEGGWGSIQVPMQGLHTREDLSVTDPKERERLFGQSDHVRQYGRDFICRLQAAGFEVLEYPKQDTFTPAEIARLSVDCEDGVILVRKKRDAKEGEPVAILDHR